MPTPVPESLASKWQIESRYDLLSTCTLRSAMRQFPEITYDSRDIAAVQSELRPFSLNRRSEA